MITKTIEKYKDAILSEDLETSKFFISRPTTNPKESKLEKKYFNIYLKTKNDADQGTYFETIEFLAEPPLKFVKSLFIFIAENSKPISESVKQIEMFFDSEESIDLKMARGCFAELDLMIKNDLEIVHKNAIYDFRKDGKDIEIKSMSKSNQVITISNQQATNNPEATILCAEVIETSKGVSVKELLEVNDIFDDRYNFLRTNKSKFLDVKFEVSKVKEKKVADLFEGLYLPENIIDAEYKVLIK